MASSLDAGLTVRAVGPVTAAGRIPLAELSRIAATLQATLERLAMSISGGRQKLGRRPTEISNAVRMDFTGFRHGSAVLEMDRANPGTLDDLLGESFEVLSRGLAEIRATGQRPTGEIRQHFTPAVVDGLGKLCGGISAQNLTEIEFLSGSHVHFKLDVDMQSRIRRIRGETLERETVVVGRLHMGDFDPMALRCRIDTTLSSIWCDFDIELKEDVIDRLDQLIAATGMAEYHSDGSSIRILHLTEISPVETANAKSLDQLTKEQGIAALSDASQLQGEPIDDFDVFLEAIRGARGPE